MVIQKFQFTRKALFKLGLIITLSFILGYFIPMIIAKGEKVYFTSDLKTTFLNDKTPTLSNQRKSVRDYDQRLITISNQISFLETELIKDRSNEKEKLELLEYYKNELNSDAKPISFRPLYNNHLMFFWVFVFISLSTIIFIVSEVKPKEILKKFDLKYIFSVFVFLYPIYRLPSWLRNLPEGQTDAKLIYYANLNFAKWSFFYQELEALITTLLLSIIVWQWIKLFQVKKTEFEDCNKNYFQRIFEFDYINNITSTFFNWQIASICLVPTFVWYATYYWNNVILTHDTRYILPSIIVHTMLISVWTIISLPTIITYFDFARCKLEAKKHIYDKKDWSIEEKNFWIHQINDVKPVSFWNFAISSASGIISILLPVLGILK
jgi:hypothetical protein